MLAKKTNVSIKSICHVEPHCVLDKLLCHQNKFTVLKPGVSSVPGCAADVGDPSTLNAELRHNILTQTPNQPSENMFQMDSRTWAISLSAEGKIQLGRSPLFCIEVLEQL